MFKKRVKREGTASIRRSENHDSEDSVNDTEKTKKTEVLKKNPSQMTYSLSELQEMYNLDSGKIAKTVQKPDPRPESSDFTLADQFLGLDFDDDWLEDAAGSLLGMDNSFDVIVSDFPNSGWADDAEPGVPYYRYWRPHMIHQSLDSYRKDVDIEIEKLEARKALLEEQIALKQAGEPADPAPE